MKIAHFLLGRCNPDKADGISQTVFFLSQEQARHGHEVAIYSITAKPAIPVPNVTVHTYPPVRRLPFPMPSILHDVLEDRSPFNLPRALVRDLLAWRPDMVHLHFVNIPQNVLLARHLHRAGIPYCVTPHGFMAVRSRQRRWFWKLIFHRLFERRFLQQAAFIHAVSRWDAEGVTASGITTRVVTLPNGINLASLPAAVDAGLLRRRYPQLTGKRVLLFLGRLDVEQKGLDLLLQATAHAGGDLALVLVGPDWRGGQPALEKLRDDLGLGNRVFFAGTAYGPEKWHLLAGADVFVHLSRWEGSPFAVAEALAAGKPVLATAAADPEDFTRRYRAGWLVEPTVPAASAALHEIAQLPAGELAARGANARRAVEAELQWAGIAERMLKAYRESC